MKATIRDLAKYLNLTEATLYHKKRTRKNEWLLLWNGWISYVKENNESK